VHTRQGERFYQVYQLPDPTVRNQVNVPKKVIAPAHAKREYQATVDMLETVGCVTKQIENNSHILHGRKSGDFLERAEISCVNCFVFEAEGTAN
jgi:hypothetical protein